MVVAAEVGAEAEVEAEEAAAWALEAEAWAMEVGTHPMEEQVMAAIHTITITIATVQERIQAIAVALIIAMVSTAESTTITLER